jgi:hypothetical protein
MRDEIAKAMDHADLEPFWRLLISRDINNRRLVGDMACGFEYKLMFFKNLFGEMPQLRDKNYVAADDTLLQDMSDLKRELEADFSNPDFGCLVDILEIPEEGGFRQAVMDHINTRLGKEAKDPMLNQTVEAVNTEIQTTTPKVSDMDGTITRMKRRDELKTGILPEYISAKHIKQQEIFKRGQELESSMKPHRERLQALGHSIKGDRVVPTFNIDLMQNLRFHSPDNWDNCNERAERCQHLFQMRLRSIVDFLSSSSNTAGLEQTLALMKKWLGAEHKDIFTFADSVSE